MKVAKYAITALAVSFVSGAIGYSNSIINPSDRNSSHQHTIEQNKINVSATWGEEPASLEDFVAKSDLIVIGKVTGNSKNISPYDFDKNEVFTQVNIQPKFLYKGTEKGHLKVSYYGGFNDKHQEVVWENIQALNKNEYYLLFLNKIKDSSSPLYNTYVPLSGPDGAYKLSIKNIKDLKLKNLDDLKVEEDLKYVQATLDETITNTQKRVINVPLEELINKFTAK